MFGQVLGFGHSCGPTNGITYEVMIGVAVVVGAADEEEAAEEEELLGDSWTIAKTGTTCRVLSLQSTSRRSLLGSKQISWITLPCSLNQGKSFTDTWPVPEPQAGDEAEDFF